MHPILGASGCRGDFLHVCLLLRHERPREEACEDVRVIEPTEGMDVFSLATQLAGSFCSKLWRGRSPGPREALEQLIYSAHRFLSARPRQSRLHEALIPNSRRGPIVSC